MTDPEAVELLPVTQSDRDAAADLSWALEIEHDHHDKRRDYHIRRGTADHHKAVQAFAKHRIASNPIADSGLAVGDQLAALKAKRAALDAEINAAEAGISRASYDACLAEQLLAVNEARRKQGQEPLSMSRFLSGGGE